MRTRVAIGLAIVVIALSAVFARGACTRAARGGAIDGRAAAQALCLAEREFHEAHGAWLPINSADELRKLDFDPGTAGLQFEVRVGDGGVECFARADAGVFTASTP